MAEAVPSGVEVAPGVRVAEGALRFGFARSSGPGGQNVNKVNTKVELWVAVGALAGLHPEAAERLRGLAGRRLTSSDEIHLTAETSRSQEGNRAAAGFVVRLGAVRSNKIVRVLAVRKDEHLYFKVVRHQFFDGTACGIEPRRIAVVIDNNFFRKAAKQL